MAIIHCSECNKEISDKAESCPSFGAPVDGTRDLSKCPKCGSKKTVSAAEMHPVGCLVMIIISILLLLFFWPLGILWVIICGITMLGVGLFGRGKMACKACRNVWRLEVEKKQG